MYIYIYTYIYIHIYIYIAVVFLGHDLHCVINLEAKDRFDTHIKGMLQNSSVK